MIRHVCERAHVRQLVDGAKCTGAVATIDGLDFNGGEQPLGVAPENSHASIAYTTNDRVVDGRTE